MRSEDFVSSRMPVKIPPCWLTAYNTDFPEILGILQVGYRLSKKARNAQDIEWQNTSYKPETHALKREEMHEK